MTQVYPRSFLPDALRPAKFPFQYYRQHYQLLNLSSVLNDATPPRTENHGPELGRA